MQRENDIKFSVNTSMRADVSLEGLYVNQLLLDASTVACFGLPLRKKQFNHPVFISQLSNMSDVIGVASNESLRRRLETGSLKPSNYQIMFPRQHVALQ